MKSDALFFIGILLFLFIAWVASGGPQRPISFSGPFITPITNVGQNQEGYGEIGSFAPSWNGSRAPSVGNNTEDIQKNLWNVQDDLEDTQRTAQEERMFGTPSPYRGKVELSGGNLSETAAGREYVTLTASSREPVTISGWRVVSVGSNRSATIPSGTSLLKSGSVNATAPIALESGERAYVVTGRSPVGVSFRENSCIGYLNAQSFTPSISSSCPSPSSDFSRFYDGAATDYQSCRAAVQSLPSCEVPARPKGVSDGCYTFMRTYLSYNSCVTYHASDSNFWGRTWRIYIGQSNELWRAQNDTLKLLDENGLTVDIYSY